MSSLSSMDQPLCCYSDYYCKQNLPAASSSSSLYLGRPNQPKILTLLYSLINLPMETKIIISHLKRRIPTSRKEKHSELSLACNKNKQNLLSSMHDVIK